MRYYIGLDNGGTTTKAVLFSEDGRQLCEASGATEALRPAPGFAERDIGSMKEANFRVLRELMDRSGADPRDIRGIGVCGHGKGLYVLDADGRPVRNGILSSDGRALDIELGWERDGTADRVFDIALQRPIACQPAALLAWLRDNEPESYSRVGMIFACKDLVRYFLTGEAFAEITDASGSGLLDLRTAGFSPELLELYGIPEMLPALPPVRGSFDVCGGVDREAAERTGLAEGTPVIGGMFDIDSCALASGVFSSDELCVIAGTWAINEYIREDPVTDGSVRLNSLYCLPGRYLIEESSPTSAGNLEWLITEILPELRDAEAARGGSVYGLLNEWVSGCAPTEEVPVFLPFLMGSNMHPRAKGCLVGLDMGTGRDRIARAVYEGVVFSHRYHIERLLASRKEPPSLIRLSGGAAKSPVWAQMFADALGMPVETIEAGEAGALGCAIGAAFTSGAYPSLEEAARAMSAPGCRLEPDPALREIYDRKYARYIAVSEALGAAWDCFG